MEKIDTLIIIGNGFDIWQGIRTSYSDFENYYHENLPKILKKLHLKPVIVREEGEPELHISSVEMLYNDPFDPYYLDTDFWNTFEASLAKIDAERINLYYGKNSSDLKDIQKTSKDATRILKRAFADWVTSKEIESKDSGYAFLDNCMVVNFNYTDTVEKRFGVRAENDYHIHGEASDPESIIVGHSSHPEYPLEQLKHMGGRFRGLYYIEKILYETDKHVDDNFNLMACALAMRGINIADIKKVYILGHSFGDADFDYFRHLAHALNEVDEDPFEGVPDWQQKYLENIDGLDFFHLNLQYAIHRGLREMNKTILEYPDLIDLNDEFDGEGDVADDNENSYYRMSVEDKISLEAAAVHMRFLMEQAQRDEELERQFFKIMKKGLKKKDRKKFKKTLADTVERSSTDLTTDNKDRKNQPAWYISYYSDGDKAKITEVLEKVGVKNYQLYPSIDECIREFEKA